MNIEKVQEEEKRLLEDLTKRGFSGIEEWVGRFYDWGIWQLVARALLKEKGFKELCTPEGIKYLVQKYGSPKRKNLCLILIIFDGYAIKCKSTSYVEL